MNKYDERYEIRLANRNDIDAIMTYIDVYWKKGHIMASDRMLFEYEYVEGENVNFVLAIDKTTQEIEGIFGFLNCSQATEPSKKDIWGSMWMVNDNTMPLLGIELARRVYDLTGCRRHIGSGANPKTTVPLRRLFFGEKVGKMKHYYFLNSEIIEYKIADIKEKNNKNNLSDKEQAKLIKFNSIEEVKAKFNVETIDSIPYKDNWYIEKRFFNHPYYEYGVYGIMENDANVEALLVTREIECNGSRVLRIVDYFGDQKIFAETGGFLYKLMQETQYEYIDFYTLGFNEEYIISAGFKEKDEKDVNIIPNYFEPFVRGNADIWVHYKDEGTLFFKADGDQDRPNLLRSM